MSYERFHLVLMVTHQCNLRCDYCYTGAKSPRSMTPDIGRAALDRAIRSLRPGGVLELGFFGGEPLLEAELLGHLIDHARRAARAADVRLRMGLTTNGTLGSPAAWQVMTLDDLDLCVSHDGLADVHNRHRRDPDGRGTSAKVRQTLVRLLDAGRDVRVAMVVRPDALACLTEGILSLRGLGVRCVDLTLDVWAQWSPSDMGALEASLARAAEIWRAGLPDGSINWFDEKAAHLAGVPMTATARCGFGDGQIAVAPSGSLYPCERLIGEDGPDQAWRLPGHASDEGAFAAHSVPRRATAACAACAVAAQCNTTCRCNNFVRTGDVSRPDALLCLVDKVCFRETARVLGRPSAACPAGPG